RNRQGPSVAWPWSLLWPTRNPACRFAPASCQAGAKRQAAFGRNNNVFRLLPPERLRPFLLVAWLEKLELGNAGHLEGRHQSVAMVGNRIGELHSLALELRHGFVDVIATKRNVVRSGGCTFRGLCGMTAHLRLRKVENEPAFAHVGEGKSQLVANESAERVRFRGVKHGVYARDHGFLLEWGSKLRISISIVLCCAKGHDRIPRLFFGALWKEWNQAAQLGRPRLAAIFAQLESLRVLNLGALFFAINIAHNPAVFIGHTEGALLKTQSDLAAALFPAGGIFG